jgi:hypothetical protein
VRLLVVGILVAALSVLLTTAVVIGYHADDQQIPRFSGTGIAAKIDAFGPSPRAVEVENEATLATTRVDVASNGTFAARLAPGTYRLTVRYDSRAVTIAVPGDDCVEVILDYRVPGLVLQIPG